MPNEPLKYTVWGGVPFWYGTNPIDIQKKLELPLEPYRLPDQFKDTEDGTWQAVAGAGFLAATGDNKKIWIVANVQQNYFKYWGITLENIGGTDVKYGYFFPKDPAQSFILIELEFPDYANLGRFTNLTSAEQVIAKAET